MLFKYLLTILNEEYLAMYFILYDLQVFWFSSTKQKKIKREDNSGGPYITSEAQEYLQQWTESFQLSLT